MTTFRITPTTSVVTTLMGDHAFEGDSTGADQLVVDSGAFLLAIGRAAEAAHLAPTNAWNVTVNGTVASSEYYGLVLDAGNAASSTIMVGAEGEVSGQTSALSLRSAAAVTNHGLIGTSGLTAIAINGAGQHRITNTGTIEAHIAIYDFDGLSQEQVTNSGTVIGRIDLGGGADMLTNTGRITGGLVAVNLGAGADVFTNYATVDGIVTSGAVTGRINLGEGDDRFLGGGGAETVQDGGGADSVALGGGDDVYIPWGSFGADGTDKISGSAGVDTYDASEAGFSVVVNLDTVSHDLSPFFPGSNRTAAGTAMGSTVAGAGSDSISGFENATGSRGADILYGSGGANVLEGGDGADHLLGYGGADRLAGGASLDNLTGGAGRDVLLGGAGADYFHFTSTGHSGVTAVTRDLITDFEDGQDVIALDRIDAKAGTTVNDAFTFIGSNAAFTGQAGELRSFYTATGQRVECDVNGDGLADFSIALSDATHAIGLSAADFVL